MATITRGEGITIPILEGQSNYLAWHAAFRRSIRWSEDLWDIFTGSLFMKEPTFEYAVTCMEGNSFFAEWTLNDMKEEYDEFVKMSLKAKNFLLETVSEDIAREINPIERPSEAYDFLRQKYVPSREDMEIFYLEKLDALRFEDCFGMADYIYRMTRHRRELEKLGSEMGDKVAFVQRLIDGLPPAYRGVVEIWEEERFTADEASSVLTDLLLDEEARLSREEKGKGKGKEKGSDQEDRSGSTSTSTSTSSEVYDTKKTEGKKKKKRQKQHPNSPGKKYRVYIHNAHGKPVDETEYCKNPQCKSPASHKSPDCVARGGARHRDTIAAQKMAESAEGMEPDSAADESAEVAGILAGKSKIAAFVKAHGDEIEVKARIERIGGRRQLGPAKAEDPDPEEGPDTTISSTTSSSGSPEEDKFGDDPGSTSEHHPRTATEKWVTSECATVHIVNDLKYFASYKELVPGSVVIHMGEEEDENRTTWAVRPTHIGDAVFISPEREDGDGDGDGGGDGGDGSELPPAHVLWDAVYLEGFPYNVFSTFRAGQKSESPSGGSQSSI